MLIGFSSGCLYKTHNPLAPETFRTMRNLGCEAVEVMIHWVTDTEDFAKITKADLEGFRYVSVHAPIYRGADMREQYIASLAAIEKKHKEIGFDAVVVHPSLDTDWEMHRQFDLPYVIENMDSRKTTCKNVTDMRLAFESFDVPFVLDVNHVYSNDTSMQLADNLLDAFGDRLCEVHLSGYTTFHDPLYVTQQREILDVVPRRKDLPIIIESVVDNEEDLKKEYEYIRNYFNL